MSLIEAASCDLNPPDEWASVGAQASRDAVVFRTGTASLKGDMGVANATAVVYGWGSSGARQSFADINWTVIALRLNNAPVGANVFGPVMNALAAGAQPCVFAIDTALHPVLYDAGLNILQTSAQVVTAGVWNILRTEWHIPLSRVRGWLWNSATLTWSLCIDYTAPGGLAIGAAFYWGFHHYKVGSLNCLTWIDDILWNDSIPPYNDTMPVTPAECYAGYPVQGAPTYNAWAGDYQDVDDLIGGGANDGDATIVISAGNCTRESWQLTDAIAPGNRPLLGVGFSARTRTVVDLDGQISQFIIVSAVEQIIVAVMPIRNVYFMESAYTERTPSGLMWTPTLLDGTEQGLHRVSGANNAYCTCAHVVAAKCDLEPSIASMDNPQLSRPIHEKTEVVGYQLN